MGTASACIFTRTADHVQLPVPLSGTLTLPYAYLHGRRFSQYVFPVDCVSFTFSSGSCNKRWTASSRSFNAGGERATGPATALAPPLNVPTASWAIEGMNRLAGGTHRASLSLDVNVAPAIAIENYADYGFTECSVCVQMKTPKISTVVEGHDQRL